MAVIGDGSFTGGLAFEALNHAGQLGRKLIIVLNDNNMPIGQNVGAFSVHLTRLTATRTFRLFRNTVDRTVSRIPFIGKNLLRDIQRLKRALLALARRNPSLTAVTAAICAGTGLDRFAREFPKRLYDVGIAEQHAVSFGRWPPSACPISSWSRARATSSCPSAASTPRASPRPRGAWRGRAGIQGDIPPPFHIYWLKESTNLWRRS